MKHDKVPGFSVALIDQAMGHPVSEPLPTLRQVLDCKPSAFPRPVRVKEAPEDEFHYSSGGYVVVQKMIEDVAGQPFAHLAKEWIFDPLGMTQGTFEPMLPENTATAHRRDGTPVPGKGLMYPGQTAAGLWSNLTDLARLSVEIIKSYNNESNLVISAEMTLQMLFPEQSHRPVLGTPVGVRASTVLLQPLQKWVRALPGWPIVKTASVWALNSTAASCWSLAESVR